MTHWQSAKIPANSINIYYTRTGGDKPPVVLAHGFSDDGLCWTPVAEILAADYEVIMVDARGHGRSDAPEQGYSLVDMAADLAAVITGLGLHKPAILGHSMGGGTTYVLAGTYPDLPGAILIEDSGARNLAAGDSPEASDRQRQMRERMSNLQSQSREALLESARVNTPTWPEAELGPWAEAKLRFNLRALNRLGASVVNWEAILSQITCPALLITADPERGAMVTPEGAAHLKTLIPQLEVVNIPEAGHNIRREQPDLYMKAVRRFLSRATS
jgi:pimeloyl-ACP methyl ester carboxylesterase